MALSGYFITSDSGQGGGGYYGQLVFEWWRDSWGRSGGVGYHNISYTLKTYGGSASYWQYAYNNSMNVDGTGYSRGQTQAYGAGATTILNGGKTLYTDGAGNRSFGASAQAGIYTNAINTSGSGSWALDNIPMYATISGYSAGITDEASSVYVNYSNPTGSACTFKLYVRPLGSTGGFTQVLNYANYPSGGNVASSVDWASVRSTLANYKQGQLIYRISNNVGDTDIGWENQALLTIVNADPVFTTATYKDANSASVAITGNDQYLIQGVSTLEVAILSTNKAVAQKSATMTKYNLAISSISTDVTYTTSDIAQNLGTLGINANATLNVKAIDSRTNFKTVPLTVNVLPYGAPQISATVQRVNNFETSTNFHIEGTISRLTIAGTDKNTVNTSTGVRYRYKKTTDASWGSWVNKTSSTSAGAVSVTDFNVPTALDRNFAWDIQIEITDKLNTTTSNIVLPVGIPIFRIGLDGKVYNNEKALVIYEVGDYHQTTSATWVADRAVYGETWVFDHIELPYHKYAFSANGNYSQASGTYSTVNPTERYDYGSAYSGGTFTAPFACIVQLNMTAYFEGIGGTVKLWNIIPSSTTNNATAELDTRDAYPQDGTVSTQFNLASSETAQFKTYNSSAGTGTAHVTGHIVADLRTSAVSGQMNVYRRTA